MIRGFQLQPGVRLALVVIGAVAPTPLAALDCTPPSALMSLFPGDRAAFVASGEPRDTDVERAQQVAAAGREPPDPARTMEAGIGMLLACGRGWPMLRLEVSGRDAGEGNTRGITRLVAGQQVTFGSWYASAEHSFRESETRYSAALYLPGTPRPLVFEASRRRRADGWVTWLTGGMYLLAGENYELGIAFSDGGGLAAGQYHAKLNFTAEF